MSKQKKEIIKTEHFQQSIENLREKEIDNQHFWGNFIKSLGVEPRDYKEIQGKSGVKHKVLAIGVNDKENRLVLVSDTPSAEHAAMMQVDVQNTTNLNLVIARPVAFNVVKPLEQLTNIIEGTLLNDVSFEKFSEFAKSKEQETQEAISQILGPMSLEAYRAFRFTPLSIFSQVLQLANQLSLISYTNILENEDKGEIDLSPALGMDVTHKDRDFGICPIPLFEFTEDQMELFLSGSNTNEIHQVLKNKEIYQYFFPNPEDVGLGLVDNGVTKVQDVKEALVLSPKIGHPYEDQEGSFSEKNAKELIDYLVETKQLEEADILKITPNGEEQQFKIKTRPAESFVIKLIKAVFNRDIHIHFPPN